jgi:hypothetical protein
MNNTKRWYDELFAFLILTPILLVFIPVMTFKYKVMRR